MIWIHLLPVFASVNSLAMNLSQITKQLISKRTALENEIARLNAALTAISGLGPGRTAKPGPKPRKKRKMSAAGRARIAAAQKKRWAKARKGKAVKTAKKKRRMSAAVKAAMSAAAKARWAKAKAAKTGTRAKK